MDDDWIIDDFFATLKELDNSEKDKQEEGDENV